MSAELQPQTGRRQTNPAAAARFAREHWRRLTEDDEAGALVASFFAAQSSAPRPWLETRGDPETLEQTEALTGKARARYAALGMARWRAAEPVSACSLVISRVISRACR